MWGYVCSLQHGQSAHVISPCGQWSHDKIVHNFTSSVMLFIICCVVFCYHMLCCVILYYVMLCLCLIMLCFVMKLHNFVLHYRLNAFVM